ncbi:MAG: hypothetical protein ACYC2H_04335 [Thermoplasmatota archaeon]
MPAFSPERHEGDAEDPAFDPASYVDEVLLTFNVDSLRAVGETASAAGEQSEAAMHEAFARTSELNDTVDDTNDTLSNVNDTLNNVNDTLNNADPQSVPDQFMPVGTPLDSMQLSLDQWLNYTQYAGSGSSGGSGGGAAGASYVGPSGYSSTPCAYEGQYCSFSGNRDVAYGNNGKYYYKFAVNGGTTCSYSNFGGDPIYGVHKACWTKTTSTSGTTYTAPSGYSSTPCAYEGQYCSFSGTRDVAYGNSGKYYYKYGVTGGGTTCSYSNFGGDPNYGVHKACWTKSASGADPGTVYTGPSGYSATPCAYETQYCTVSGTMDIAYGNSGRYYYKYGVSGGTTCAYTNFGGDPYYGVHKACWTRPSSGGTTYVPPSGYTFCAYEGQYCSFSGTRDVAYGNNGYYYYKYGVTGGTTCTYTNFGGDPIYGVHKACYTREGGSSTQTGCSPSGWVLRANHWKWINRVVTHAPYGGSATALVSAATTTEEYYFGSGSSTQVVTGEALGTSDGLSVGLYKLMGAAYYTRSPPPSGCEPSNEYRVVLTESSNQKDSLVKSLHGSSQTTDGDDLTGFWAYTAVVGADVQAVTLYHQFQARDNGRTVGSTGESCREVSNVGGKIQGIDLSISFTPTGSTVGVSGTVSYKTTQTATSSYRYCFGNNHSYDWDNLGGTSDSLASAFRTNW